MQYAGFLIRKKRMERNWSQEGLCKGICTVSYLSKIEQGKAAPSPEIVSLLLERMGLSWMPSEEGGEWIERAYERLFSDEIAALRSLVKTAPPLENSRFGLDYLLLTRFVAEDRADPLDPALEVCMEDRSLALQRILQGRYTEALRLYPCAFFYLVAGEKSYSRGDTARAMELLQTACQLAAEEGRARVLMYARINMGNCYSNLRDPVNMEHHYRAARRLAVSLGAKQEERSLAYNTAATQMELGEFAKAKAYFESLAEHDRMSLHKLAICYEKLGERENALEALDRADAADTFLPAPIGENMCGLVRLRLENDRYLDDPAYEKALFECFSLCRKELPIGYAIFHLPWMLEWYEHRRQYKQAYSLLRDFPEYRHNP